MAAPRPEFNEETSISKFPVIDIGIGDSDKIRPISDEDLERSDAEKMSVVHFLRFEFDDSQIKALKGGARLSACIDHDNYRIDVSPVAENVRNALISDLD